MATESENTLELTDRELALCQGEDPDAKPVEVPEAVTAEVQDGAVAEGQEVTPVEQPVKEDVTGGSKEAAGSSWLKPEHTELAKGYGLSEDDVKSFSSPEEFSRATRLLDKQLLAIKPAQPAAVQATPAEVVAEAKESTKTGMKKLDLEKLKSEGYDNHSLELFANHNDLVDHIEKQEQRFSALERAAVQAESQRVSDTFHDIVDSLGDKRFGKSVGADGKPVQTTEAEEASRRKLWETVEELTYGHIARQRATGKQEPLPPLPAMIRRANAVAFAEEIRADDKRKQEQSIREQSNKRRPVASGRGVDGRFSKQPSESSGDPVTEGSKAIASNPAVVAMWNKFQEANGVA